MGKVKISPKDCDGDLFYQSENHEKQKKVEISKEDLYNESGYPRGSRILYVGLKDHESLPWSWFTDHPVCQHAQCDIGWESVGKVVFDLDHPVIPLVSNFAITAFNKLSTLYYKNKVDESIYDAQVTNVICWPNSFGYMFSIEVEALEEDVIGVYEAKVLSTRYGRRTLIDFTRTLCSPTGTKYKGIYDLNSVKLISDAVQEKKKHLKSLLNTRRKARKGENQSRLTGISRSKRDYAAFAGVCRLFDNHAPQLNQTSLKIKTSNPAEWLVPSETTGLQRRSNEHTCGGYDYVNPLKVFSCYK